MTVIDPLHYRHDRTREGSRICEADVNLSAEGMSYTVSKNEFRLDDLPSTSERTSIQFVFRLRIHKPRRDHPTSEIAHLVQDRLNLAIAEHGESKV